MDVTCVIIGQGTIAAICGETLLERGVTIVGMVSTEPELVRWAADHGIPCRRPGAHAASFLRETPFDYLFSIVNPAILPDEVLSLPRRLAVNFHDGPLPRYAGVNAPSWALIHGERRHAVTWHTMTAGVDEGPILEQRWFDIAAGETALSLNTRCYTEGAASFADLLPRLLAGEVTPRTQDLARRSYFGRRDRPDAVLNFRRPAESLRGLVAGLDFGSYPNPLALATVWLGEEAAVVESLRVLDTASTAPPGTVIAAGDGELRVATTTEDVVVRLAGGRVVESLPVLPEPERARISELAGEVAAHERYWLRRLREIAPPEGGGPAPLPPAGGWGRGQRRGQEVHVEVTTPREELPAVMAFLARLTPGAFDVAFVDNDRLAGYPKEFFARAVPWRAPVDASRPFADAVTSVRSSLDELAAHATYANDLPARHSLEVGLPTTITISDGPVRFSRPDLADRFSVFLRGIDAGLPVGEVALVDAAERDALLALGQAPDGDGEQVCVHHLVESVAAANPDAIAVRMADRRLTYAELNRRANRVAHHLLARGAAPDTLVGLRLERSIDLVVGLLGILKSGAAYLPLDPRYPADRLAFMISDARARIVLDSLAGLAGCPETNPDAPCSPSSLAYVIYTSGSTGTPKGCAVEHRHLATTLLAAGRELGFGATDTFPNLASHAFDISLLELLLPLVSGGCTVLVDAARTTDLSYVVEQTRDATFFHAVPSLMSAWLDHLDGDDYPALRCLLVGGDAVPRRLVDALGERFPAAEVVELYGPTEATIISTFHRASDGATDVPHCIGRRFDHTSTYVLDASMQPLPMGATGELYLGGATIARGYLRREALDAERFVPDPFTPGGRLYRTGDLVRLLADGSLEFLGRADSQIKIRGYRIEPGEIESALAAHELVDAAVVVARDGHTGKQLVAYVTSTVARLPDLTAYLAETLPDYLIPSHVARLDRLPLNANGKIDRAALPAPEQGQGFRAPRTTIERELCALWQELLGVPRVGVRDNFFSLGGHSLQASRLVTRIRERLHAEVAVRTVFEAPTVEALAGHIGARATPGIPRATERDRYPLSLAQQRIWLHELLEPGTSYYNIPPALVKLEGPIDVPALERAFAALIERHESLRTTYDAAEPWQRVTRVAFRLERTDDLAIARRYAEQPFDLAAGPPLRAALVRLETQVHVLVVAMHHIASDGTSFGVLFDELSALYRGDPLPPLPIRYVDYAAWDRDQARDVAYWTDALAGLPQVHGLRSDRPRPRTQSHRGALVVRSLACRDALLRLAREHETTLFTVLETAFAALLHRFSGATDLAVGTPVANREHAETAGLVGCFVNTVVLRSDLSDAPSFAELLGRTAGRVREALEHAAVPFEQVVGALNPQRDAAHHPLFQVMFAFEDGHAPHFAGARSSLLDPDYRSAKFDLTLYVRDHNGRLSLVWEYATDLFDAETVAGMAESFEVLVAGILADPHERLARLPILSTAQRDALRSWNDTTRPFPAEGTIHELFEAQADRTPDAVALSFEGRTMTYAELNRRANRLAHQLIERGVRPDDRVGLRTRRGMELVIGVYGIWKAGAAYVPLDPSYPEARLRQFSEGLVAVLAEEELSGSFEGYREGNPGRCSSAGDLAYVIFTSGSTGVPKGVMVSHRALVNRIDWMQREYRLTPGDVVLHKTPFGFDVSVWELTWPLVTGARLVIAVPEGHRDPDYLTAVIRAEGVTTLHFVPSMLRAMLDSGRWVDCHPVRQVFCSGEALPRSLEAGFFATGTRARLHNLYGPTEAAIDVGHWECSPDSGLDVVPIGRPIQNIALHVLDTHLREVPPGVAGELHIAGVGLARGYLDRQDLTDERFIAAPIAERLYRTGDLVRRRHDGAIEFLGRLDHQVKIRGFRIELGEIEATLADHPEVHDVVVVARGERLVAYLVTSAAEDELRRHLGQLLPDYLVPDAFVAMAALPLGANGKLDRAALPEPTYAVDGTALETEVERELAVSWQDLLGLDAVGASTNFFHVGGHSLLATRLVADIRARWRVDIGIASVFEHQTIRALATAIERAGERDDGAIRPIPRDEELPLSFAQQRFWLLDQLNPDSRQHAIMAALRLDGPLSATALEETLRRLIARHEILRTAYVNDHGRPRQIVRDRVDFELPVVELSEEDVERAAREEIDRPFDLSADPMLRARLIRLGERSHVLLLTVHHIASDGWSNGILYREINAIYRSVAIGVHQPLAPVEIQYADYAAWQRVHLAGDALAGQLEYWTAELAGIPAVHALPLDRPRPAVQSHRGDVVVQTLDADLTARLHELAAGSDATLFMVLHAAFASLIGRRANTSDVVIGTTLANRERRESSGTVGPFMNPVALRADLAGDPSFGELIAQSRRRALGAYEHQQVPFELLLDALGIERSPAYAPLMQLMLILHNNEGGAIDLPGIATTPLRHEHAQARLDLILDAVENDGELRIDWEYCGDLFDRATVERTAAGFECLLRAVVSTPDTRISRLPLLSDAERHTTLVEWHGPARSHPEHCVHELFEAQAARRPDAIAVVDGTRTITYGALNAMANRLAHTLIGRGVGPGTSVGVHRERSIEMVAGFLGVLKAGGCYVPISPDLPEARVRAIVEDARLAQVVTEGERFDGPTGNPAGRVAPTDLAYTIFTSGSTGRPKGVQVEHRAILSSYHAWAYCYGLAEGTTNHLQLAGIGFDVCVGDLVRALCSGGKLVICPKETLLDPAALHQLIVAKEIHCAEFVPVTLRALVDHLERAGLELTTLRYLIAGSDSWHGEDLRRTRRVVGDHTILVNSYGLTEAGVDSTCFLSTSDDSIPAGPLPIGAPLPSVRAYVLNPSGQPCPIGVTGELHIGGPALARGYLGDGELTGRRFVADPFLAGGRMFRTGDLARWRPDGQLDLLGRIDSQIKIRGFRIEPGEVESCLLAHPAVREAVVADFTTPAGETLLAAYVVTGVEVEPLREHALAHLPDYLVPTAFVRLDRLPTNASGKVDRAALPAPELDTASDRVPPRTETEHALAGIWESLLGVESPSVRASFFSLGGHSLLAARLVALVNERWQVEVPIRALFEQPTIHRFARIVEHAATGAGTAIERADRTPALPLSSAQQRLWLIEALEPDTAQYNIATALRLDGELDVDALRRALAAIVERHEVLRTTYHANDGVAYQVVHGPVGFELARICGTPAELDDLVRAEAREPFDLGTGPVLRATLVALAPTEHVLLLTMHHIAADGWSMGVLANELTARYAAFVRGEPDPLPPLPVDYADYAVWERRQLTGDVLERHAGYWRERLDGIPAVHRLPLDRPRPARQSFRGARHTTTIGADLLEALRTLAAAHEATLFTVLHAAFAGLLARYSDETDIVMGAPVANRDRAELAPLIGFFVNTVVLRTDLAEDPTFAELLLDSRRDVLDALEHQAFPFERLVDELSPERSLSHHPVFQILLVLQNNDRGSFDLPGLSASVFTPDTGTAKFDLTLDVLELPEELRLGWEYATDLFEATTIARMAAHFERLLTEIVRSPGTRVSRLSLVDDADRQLLERWNDTVREYDRDHLVHSYVAEQPPERPAVFAYGAELTYGELERRGNRLARMLVDEGVGPDVVVGLFLSRSSIDLVVGVLAVLKAGGAYVALDLDSPAARLEHIQRDASISVVLTTSSLAGRLPGRSVCLDRLDLDGYSDEPLERRVGPDDLAYLIYTSGTTGLPKALLQTHRTLENLVNMPPRRDVLTERLTMLQYAALSFDVSIQEIVTAWKTGSELVLISTEDRVDPAAVLDLVESRRVGRLFIPTAMLYLVADEYVQGRPRDLSCLREIIVGGEALTITESIRALVEDHAIRFVNEYGPSETHAATYEIVEDLTVGSLPPVGRAIGNLRLYVVDRHGQPQPAGLPGELYIGGDGVARGYLNQPALSAEKFVDYAGERVYRSGDRVRYLDDGKLRYLGRMDHQVKIRGYRVELGEIEQLLQRHPAVRDAAVVADEDRQLLVSYVVTREAITAGKLREYLKARVPEYMVPAAFVMLDALPLTRVGKVDRRRLPEPDLASASRVLPTTRTERALLPIWQQILGVDEIGVGDNFFALGGHSLLAVRLASKIKSSLGMPVPLRSIVEFPTIAELAGRLEREVTVGTSVGPLLQDPANAYEPFPLTDIQQAYWLGRGGHFDLGNIGTHSYIELPAEGLDVARYQWAWNQLIRRHPMLRMVLTPDGEQRILEQVGEYVFAVHDGSERLAIRERMSHQVFSGHEWPLFEVCVSRVSGDRCVVHLSIDAFSLDAASYLQLFREWLHLYEHPDQPLRPLTITFRDYVLSEQRLRATDFVDASRTYWLDRLPEFPSAPNLPFAVDPSEISAPFFEGRRHFLPPARWQSLKRLAARLQVTPTVLVIGCFAEVLARWSRSPQFALNLTLFNRIDFHDEVEQLVGDFTSLTLLEIDHRDWDATLADRLAAIQSRLFADLEHRYFTGVEVQRELSRRQASPVTFPVVVTSTLGLGNRTGEDGPFDRDGIYTVSQTPQVWLDFQVSEIEGALSCNWDSVRGLFPDGMLDEMFAAFTGLLERLAEDDALARQSHVDTVPAAHRALVAKVNATGTDLRPPDPPRLHEPLLAQIRLRGDKTAVVTSARRVSYRELGLASQRLAAHIRPNRLVAVLMEKGWEQVVAVLAILRAGAAYLPIDAALPAERIRRLLELGEVEQVVTTPGIDCELPTLIVDDSLLADGELEFEAPRRRETNLAYVIFTSGSTGTPKGVMIDHRGALNTVLDINARYGVTREDTVLGLSSLSFDLSVYDIFGVLGAGGTLVLPGPDEARDPEAWLRYLDAERVTVWNTVPALFAMLADFGSGVGRLPLRLVMLSGDWIPTDLPARIASLAPDAAVRSLGGATEASIWSIDYPIDDVDPSWRSIPYGKPLANQHFYVLKRDLDLAPVGSVGDLYIGGVGIALGYWRDAEKTARSFLTHPVTGERLYRTGDLGRLLPDGNIEFLGRDDAQVKIQGHRIELGEIEARLAEHPGVREAVVATNDLGRTKQLVAYVVPASDDLSIHGEVIADETERTLFTLQRKGIRADLDGVEVVLPRRSAALRVPGEALPGPMALDELAALFDAMAEDAEPAPKRYYPSAGGLYPVQIYVSVRDVAGLQPGSYYFRPTTHSLVRTSERTVDGDGPATVCLVADDAAITPMYGRNCDEFCRLEAGYLAHLLRAGGSVLRRAEVGEIASAFQLGGTHRPLMAFSVQRASSEPALALSLTGRKSYRAFQDTAVTERALLSFLPEDPVLRVVVWIRGLGWHELDAGRLRRLHDDRDPTVVFRHSADILATAGFGVLLLGERTDEALYRAGALGQAMMIAGTNEHIGLCPIGAVDGALHAFLGGVVSEEQIRSTEVSTPATDLSCSVREYLGTVLPAYMVPAHVLRIDRIPLSANGKVDRKALPAPEGRADDGARVAPAGATEKALAAIWQEVLARADVGVTDNFFDLGGDSMHAISVLTRAKRQGIRFSVRDLYTHQTIERLAAVATQAPGAGERAIEPFALLSTEQRREIEPLIAGLRDAYPQTSLQQGMIFHNLVDPERGTYHEVISTHLRLGWDQERFRAALRELTARHDVLRTVFHGEMQLVLATVEPRLDVADITHLDAAAQAAHIRRWIAEERTRPFDPDRPAWQVVVHLRGENELQYSLVCHHALLDGWSVARFDAELFAAYQGDSPDPTPPMPYGRFVAAELEAARSEPARRHWTAKLADAPLPWWTGATRGRPRRRSIDLGADSYALLRSRARSLGVADKSVFLAAHVALISLLSGTPDVVTSVVANCRPEAEGAERALGLFLNSVPFRVDRRGRTWAELIRAVDAAQLEDGPFTLYPLANIQEDTGLDLAASLFTFVNFHVAGAVPTLGDDSVDTTNYLLATEVAKNEAAQAFRVDLVADDGAFDERFTERIAGYYRTILDAVLREDTVIDNARLIGEEEARRLLVEWNDTTCPFPAEGTIHELFEAQAERTPDAVALSFDGQTMTYRELNARANRLAHHLIATGVRAGDLVGISARRSLELLVGVYGIWKAGAAYVPLDPSYPEARLRQLSEGLVAVLAEEELSGLFEGFAEGNPGRCSSAEDVAYVIFTSGSTGVPKGVMVSHRALVNRIDWMQREYRLTPGDVVLHKTPFGFDVSVWELTWPLVTGARLVIARPEGHRDPEYLVGVIRAEEVTTLHFVPSMLRVLLEHVDWAGCRSVRQVFCSGEALSRSLEAAFFATGTSARLHNLYGPTEAAIDVSHWECLPDSGLDVVPIGRPIQNIRLYVLSQDRQLLPAGVPGELHIGGVGLARGYLDRPDLTADRFVETDFEPRLYRTGDLVRQRDDGVIDFLGRIDHQVKIRGFRIEPGEIEAVLSGHPEVADAVVIARDERLVAYVVAPQGVDLRGHLAARLPDYLVPAAFVHLERMPLGPNGKVDRAALPAPERTQAHTPPRTATEAALCEIFLALLGVDRVGVHDPFFEIGGDSLKLVRLGAEIRRRLGVDLPVMTLFGAPTIERLAELVDGERQAERIVHELTPSRRHPALTVLCVPYAAGDGIVYRTLAEQVDDDIAVFSITNPRDFDPADPAQVADFVRRCVAEIRRQVSGPIVLWGHCVGYALALVLAERLPDVRALCLGGVTIAPDHAERRGTLADEPLDRSDIVDLLTTAGMTEIHGSITEEEWELVARKFRHDLSLSRRCDHEFFGRPRDKLPIPVYCVIAKDDPLTQDWRENAASWGIVSDQLEIVELEDGGHYFVGTRGRPVADLINAINARVPNSSTRVPISGT